MDHMEDFERVESTGSGGTGVDHLLYRYCDEGFILGFQGCSPFGVPMKITLGAEPTARMVEVFREGPERFHHYCNCLATVVGTAGEMIAAFTCMYDREPDRVDDIGRALIRYLAGLVQLQRDIRSGATSNLVIIGDRWADDDDTKFAEGDGIYAVMDAMTTFAIGCRLEGEMGYESAVFLPFEESTAVRRMLDPHQLMDPFERYHDLASSVIGATAETVLLLFSQGYMSPVIMQLAGAAARYGELVRLQSELIEGVMSVVIGEDLRGFGRPSSHSIVIVPSWIVF